MTDVAYTPVTLLAYVPAGLDSAVFTAYELPDDVAAALLALHRGLGLVHGAGDLRATPDGEHVLLEVNPADQYLFASDRADLPVPRTIGTRLDRHDAAHP